MSNHACTVFKYETVEIGKNGFYPGASGGYRTGSQIGGCGRVLGSPKPLGDNRRPRLHRPCRDVRSHSTLKGG
jgi:hypothetical protein